MAKTPKPKAFGVGTRADENTGPTIAGLQPLSHEDREALRKIFADPVYRRAFSNARLMRPSAFAGSEALNSALGSQIANNRLHQIQGWEMFEAALAKQALDPLPPRKPLEETYPDDPFFASADPSARPAPAKPSAPAKS